MPLLENETPEQCIARLDKQVTTLSGERDELTSSLETAQGSLRAKTHKVAFKEVALECGVKPKAVDSLYRELNYDPGDRDEADPAEIRKLIDKSREGFDFYFEAPEPAPSGRPADANPKPKTPPAAGQARGATPPPAAGKFRVTSANTRDPAWMLANGAAFREAGAKGTLEFVDEG